MKHQHNEDCVEDAKWICKNIHPHKHTFLCKGILFAELLGPGAELFKCTEVPHQHVFGICLTGKWVCKEK